MVFEIKEITDQSLLCECVRVIRNAFMTVVNEFNLTEKFSITKENAPTNPAFMEDKDLLAMRDKGINMFGAFMDDKMVGFVAVEKKEGKLYYMERLAVLSEYRHRGIGRKLMDFVFDYVKRNQGETVSIGIINENKVLKDWYKDYGFVETGTKKFSHLPFTVCFMDKRTEGE